MKKLVLAVLAAFVGCSSGAPEYDVLILGGTVVDGTGRSGFRADVALRGDRIVTVSTEDIARDRASVVLDERSF